MLEPVQRCPPPKAVTRGCPPCQASGDSTQRAAANLHTSRASERRAAVRAAGSEVRQSGHEQRQSPVWSLPPERWQPAAGHFITSPCYTSARCRAVSLCCCCCCWMTERQTTDSRLPLSPHTSQRRLAAKQSNCGQLSKRKLCRMVVMRSFYITEEEQRCRQHPGKL